MKKKRFLAIALVFILSVMSLTGCGGKTKTDDSSLPLSVGSDMSPQLQENDRNLKMMTPSDVHTEIGFAAKEGIYECEAYGGKYVPSETIALSKDSQFSAVQMFFGLDPSSSRCCI